MCVKAANKRLQADIGISLATWKITLSSALCEDNTLDWEGIRDESQHGTVDVAYPGTANGSHSPSAFLLAYQLCGAACVGLPLTPPRPADAVGHQRIQLSR